MNKKIFLFLTAVLVSLPFWLGINLIQKSVEDFLVKKDINKSIAENPPAILAAQISQLQDKTASSSPCQLLTISAESFFVLETNPIREFSSNGAGNLGQDKVILEKNSQSKLPLASITKLMTYLVAADFYKNDQPIKISKDIISQPESLGGLNEGEILEVKELIPMMLIESSNDAAFALSKLIGQEGFVGLMNLKAKELGLANTYFYNPTGIDPEALNLPPDQINYSTAWDIAYLTKYLLFSQPEFLNIVSQKEYPLYQTNGKLHHILKNTNELLQKMPTVIGGKTGTTDRAGECLMVIMKGKSPDDYFIGVVLNSKNRFEDMETLLSCAKEKG